MNADWLVLAVVLLTFAVGFGLKAIADAILILAQRVASHTEVVRLATLPRGHLSCISTTNREPSPRSPWPPGGMAKR